MNSEINIPSSYQLIVKNEFSDFGVKYKEFVPINDRWMAFSNTKLCLKYCRYLILTKPTKNFLGFTTITKTRDEVISLFDHLSRVDVIKVWVKSEEHDPIENVSEETQPNKKDQEDIVTNFITSTGSEKFKNNFTLKDISSPKFCAIDINTGKPWNNLKDETVLNILSMLKNHDWSPQQKIGSNQLLEFMNMEWEK